MSDTYLDRLEEQLRQESFSGNELAIAEAVLSLAGRDPRKVSPEAKEAYADAQRASVTEAKDKARVEGVEAEVAGPNGDTTTITKKPTHRGPAVGDGTNRRGEDPVYERPPAHDDEATNKKVAEDEDDLEGQPA